MAPMFSPITARYVEALRREGDQFDPRAWVMRTLGIDKACISQEIEATGPPAGVPEVAAQEPNRPPITRRYRPREGNTRRRLHGHNKSFEDRLRRRLAKISGVWLELTSSRDRDAVYRYLEAVAGLVEHYKIRRRSKRLLRGVAEYAGTAFNENVDPFTAVIRCTSGGSANSKLISKWATALRFASRQKGNSESVAAFMKREGGINACARRYAISRRRS